MEMIEYYTADEKYRLKRKISGSVIYSNIKQSFNLPDGTVIIKSRIGLFNPPNYGISRIFWNAKTKEVYFDSVLIGNIPIKNFNCCIPFEKHNLLLVSSGSDYYLCFLK